MLMAIAKNHSYPLGCMTNHTNNVFSIFISYTTESLWWSKCFANVSKNETKFSASWKNRPT